MLSTARDCGRCKTGLKFEFEFKRAVGLREGADGGGGEGGHGDLLGAARLEILAPLKELLLQLQAVVGCAKGDRKLQW